MVWRPYDCRLGHYAVCSSNETACISAMQMTDQDFDPATKKYSTAAKCLREKGIHFIAGFGDSVGEEQVKNVATLLGLPANRFSNGAHDTGIVCKGGKLQTNFHKLENHHDLATCIEASSEKLVKKLKSKNEHNMRLTSPLSPPPPPTVVLVTNFMIIHTLYGLHPLKAVEELLLKQAQVHAHLAAQLQSRYNITYRRIFFTGVARHGFKRIGLTPFRMETVNERARDILSSNGWEILDAYNITYPRLDGTPDGASYDGGVSSAITDVLFTMLCNK